MTKNLNFIEMGQNDPKIVKMFKMECKTTLDTMETIA
jgi:hypothetical protein